MRPGRAGEALGSVLVRRVGVIRPPDATLAWDNVWEETINSWLPPRHEGHLFLPYVSPAAIFPAHGNAARESLVAPLLQRV